MASETQKKSKSNVDYKYAVHFDLERNEIKQVKSNTILDNGCLSGSGNRIYRHFSLSNVCSKHIRIIFVL